MLIDFSVRACNLCFRSEIFKNGFLFNSLTTVKVSITIPFYTFKLYFSECPPPPYSLIIPPSTHLFPYYTFPPTSMCSVKKYLERQVELEQHSTTIKTWIFNIITKHFFFKIHKSFLSLHFFFSIFIIFFTYSEE